MARKTIYQISLESDVSQATETTSDVSEVIESTDTAADVIEQQYDIQSDAVAIEEGEEVINELSDNIADNEQKLEEDPASITEEDVAVAQEAYFILMKKVGCSSDVYKNRISLEQHGTPADKLALINDQMKISREGLLEVWTKVKLKFTQKIDKYISSKVKQIEGKIDTIDKLILKAKSGSGLNIEDEEKFKDYIFSNCSVDVIANSGVYEPSKFFSNIKEYHTAPALVLMEKIHESKFFRDFDEQKGYDFKKMKGECAKIVDILSKEYSKTTLQKNLVAAGINNAGNWFGGTSHDGQLAGVVSGGGRWATFVFNGFAQVETLFSKLFDENTILGGVLANVLSKYISTFYVDDIKLKNPSHLGVKHNIKSVNDVVKHLEDAKKAAKDASGFLEKVKNDYYRTLNDINKRSSDPRHWFTKIFFSDDKISSLYNVMEYNMQKCMFGLATGYADSIDGVIKVSSKVIK